MIVGLTVLASESNERTTVDRETHLPDGETVFRSYYVDRPFVATVAAYRREGYRIDRFIPAARSFTGRAMALMSKGYDR